MAKEVYQADTQEHGGLFGFGNYNEAYAKYFSGKSYLNPLTNPDETIFMANVTFEPGCRNNWHIHHAGQILVCIEGQEARSLKPGDVVTILPGVKHWHGAKIDYWFSHIAIEVPGKDTSSEWCIVVSEEVYGRI